MCDSQADSGDALLRAISTVVNWPSTQSIDGIPYSLFVAANGERNRFLREPGESERRRP